MVAFTQVITDRLSGRVSLRSLGVSLGVPQDVAVLSGRHRPSHSVSLVISRTRSSVFPGDAGHLGCPVQQPSPSLSALNPPPPLRSWHTLSRIA